MLDLTLEEYEGVRSDSNSFAVLPRHVHHEVERVVQETDRFVVVSKIGEGGEFAEELDPREES